VDRDHHHLHAESFLPLLAALPIDPLFFGLLVA